MSDRRPLRAGLLLLLSLTAVLTACRDRTQEGAQARRLPPCTAEGSVFGGMRMAAWPEHYHRTVAAVVEAHLRRGSEVATAPLLCTAADAAWTEEATEELRAMARMLPAWRGEADRLREADFVPVLLEFLRIYECSLNEYRNTRWALRTQTGAVERGPLLQRFLEENALIERELTIAQPALERTLLVTGGIDRLRPLAYGTECLKRTSLDLRNVLGLAAETSACLPRAWDVHGSLRDLAD